MYSSFTRRGLDRPVRAAPRDPVAAAQRAVPDAQQRQPADVRARVEIRDERLQRMLRVVRRRRDPLEQHVEQRRQIGRELVRVRAGVAGRAFV